MLADRGAGRGRRRCGIRTDHAGLVGEEAALPGGAAGARVSDDGVGQNVAVGIRRDRCIREGVAALEATGQN